MLAVECRVGSAPLLHVAVDVGEFWTQQSIHLRADLMGRTIAELEGFGTTPDIDAQRLPGEWRSENSLPQVAHEEEAVGPPTAQRRKKTKLGDANVLRFIHNREVERRIVAVPQPFGEQAEHIRPGYQVPGAQFGCHPLEMAQIALRCSEGRRVLRPSRRTLR